MVPYKKIVKQMPYESEENIKYLIECGIEVIIQYLKENGINLNDEEVKEYKKAIFYGPENKNEIQQFNIKINNIKDRDEMEIKLLTSLHDSRVIKEINNFLKDERKIKYMPIELIGWEEVKKDIPILTYIFEISKIRINKNKLENTYHKQVNKFLKEKGIKNIIDLQVEISKGENFYSIWKNNKEILEFVLNPDLVNEFLIPQIQTSILLKDENNISLENIENAIIKSVTLNDLESKNFEDYSNETYAEIDLILNLIDFKYVLEIPKKLRKLFIQNKKQNYKKVINVKEPLENQNLSKGALEILAKLDYNYWCKDEEKKEKLLKIFKNNEKKEKSIAIITESNSIFIKLLKFLRIYKD